MYVAQVTSASHDACYDHVTINERYKRMKHRLVALLSLCGMLAGPPASAADNSFHCYQNPY